MFAAFPFTGTKIRIIGLALLTLAACAADLGAEDRAASAQATLAYMQRPEVAARLDASAAAGMRQMLGTMTSEEAEAYRSLQRSNQLAQQRAQAGQAAATICRARGNMAAYQPAFGGFGLAGAINAGLQQGLSASVTEAECFRTWQATGIMPSY